MVSLGRRLAGERRERWSRLHASRLVWGLLAGIALLPQTAFAQVSSLRDAPPRFEWRGGIRSEFINEFDTDTDGGDEFKAWHLGVGGDFGGPINESILLGMDLGYRYASYDFRLDNAPGQPPGYGSNELPWDPWNQINTVDLAPSATILVGDSWSVVGAVPLRWSGEVGARRNAWIAGISALARWQVTDGIRIGGGLGVTSQIEGNAETFPIIALDWKISPSFDLRTEGSWFQGGSTMLLWGPNEAIRLSFSVGWERNRFRLDDNGPRADRNGVGEVRAVPIEVGLRLRFFEGAFFDFRAGLGVAGRFRVENSDGDKLYDQEYDPAPRVAIGLTIPFGLPRRETGSGAD
jgi:hypothetical protein